MCLETVCLPYGPGNVSSVFKVRMRDLHDVLGFFLSLLLISGLSVFSRRTLTLLATKTGGI